MEPKGLLPCSQGSCTSPYSEPDESSPSYLSKIHLNIIHPPNSPYDTKH
jgi:hypothetical protein